MDEDQGQNQDPEIGPPTEEYALEQKVIPFMGDELAAALTQSGGIYISLPGMCNALGLNTRGQLQRIQRTKELSLGLRQIPITTKGGRQHVNCLRLDKLGLWLAGIETARVKSQFRAKLEAYHSRLAPMAIQVFLNMAGMSASALIPETAHPQIKALSEQIDTLTAVVVFLQEHMQAWLEETGQHIGSMSLQLDQAVKLIESLVERQDETETKLQRVQQRTTKLTTSHARSVQEYITNMVRQTQQSPSPLTYSMIYGRLKTRFRINSYSEALDERYNDIMAYLRQMLQNAGGNLPEQGSLF
jgi:hypothetical protein